MFAREERARIYNATYTPHRRIVPKIAGYQVFCARRLGTFEEAIIIIVDGGIHGLIRFHKNRRKIERCEDLECMNGDRREFPTRKNIPVFSQDFRRNAGRDFAGYRQVHYLGFEALRLPASRNENVCVEYDAHLPDRGTSFHNDANARALAEIQLSATVRQSGISASTSFGGVPKLGLYANPAA